MTPSPDRDPRVLRHPDLKIAPGMLEAYGVALDYSALHPDVTVRIIDADVLLGPYIPRRREPRSVTEVFIDPTGVLVVGTGADPLRPLFRVFVPLPVPGGAVSLRVFGHSLAFYAGLSAMALAAWSARGTASQ